MAGCDADATRDTSAEAAVAVTGIHVTTLSMPDGTGEVLGSPSYAAGGRVAPLPNPYVAAAFACPSPFGCGEPERRIDFRRVPDGHRVRVYRAQASPNVRPGAVSLDAVRQLVADSTALVTLRVDASEPNSAAWGFREVPAGKRSGLYRAVLFDGADTPVEWADLYIIDAEDFATWVDPTGWLPPNWRDEYGR